MTLFIVLDPAFRERLGGDPCTAIILHPLVLNYEIRMPNFLSR